MGQDWWVFSENSALQAELIAGARSLAGHTQGGVVAVVFGPRAQAEEAIAHGADYVFWLGEPRPDQLIDDVVPSLAALVQEGAPCGILVGATRRGKAIAGRLAARLGVSAIAEVKQFLFEGDELRARHNIFGGGAVRVERPKPGIVVATVGPGIFDALPADPSHPGEILDAKFVPPPWQVTLRERKPRPPASVNLNAAKRVVCLGRGVARPEDLELMGQLARAMGAEIACTRPLAEGLNWLPRERYIGVSGANIHPDLYLGVGVSGQVQHMVGMNAARIVAAINKDPNAPIFQQADYCLVGDLYTLVPAMIEALQSRK